MSVSDAQLARAVELLAAGQLVGLPTETVYGLAADATQEMAVRKIFTLKGRPAGHPLIVHLHDVAQLADWAQTVPTLALELAEAFWPGPFTMILPRAASVLDAVTGGHPTVGLRVPGHPVTRGLLEVFGRSHSGAVAAPSANRFGRVSPTRAAHVRAEFGDALGMVLDAGPCEVGIESTIVDLSGDRPQLLRPGQISLEQIEAVIGPLSEGQDAKTPAPGTLKSHYAVEVPTYVHQNASVLPDAQGRRLGWIGRKMPAIREGAWVLELLGDAPEEFAKGLYAALRRLEAASVEAIYVERLPETPDWQGIADRISRACAGYRSSD